jgi:hypothetical protein
VELFVDQAELFIDQTGFVIVDVGWELYFWQNTYIDNIKYWNLQVDTDVPVHGRVLPLPQVLQDIQRMTKAAQDLCNRTRAAGAFMPGCSGQNASSIGFALNRI